MPNLPRVTTHPDGRYLQTEDGQPFFWLGDTAWELFHRLTREEAELYFANRQEKQFTVIQAVALAEFDGLNTPNRYDHRPLIDNDPTRPNEDYFALVDEYIDMAAAHNLYIGLLPTWGDKVTPMWGAGPAVFNPENAYTYGRFLGKRYASRTNVIWIMGGDRPPLHEGSDYRPIYREMARGIREGVAAPVLMTYHPMGGRSTGEWLHEEDWLDMNMMQSGHGGGHDVPVWNMITVDWERTPAKPTLDGEPNYEDHPVNPWPKWDPATGYYRDHDVRKQCYRSVLAGACGVTYGHHSVWQMCDEAVNPPINHADRSWREALDRPGARQVRHLRALIEARPFFSRVPDQSIIYGDPGEGGQHTQASRDGNGRYALIYTPEPRTISVHVEKLSGAQFIATWVDPRTGEWSEPEGPYPRRGVHTFTPPQGGPDWVLVIDTMEG